MVENFSRCSMNNISETLENACGCGESNIVATSEFYEIVAKCLKTLLDVARATFRENFLNDQILGK